MSDANVAKTEMTTALRPIDYEGLCAFAEKGKANPSMQGTMKTKTVCEGQFRNLTYVGEHEAVVVDEPPHLFGEDTAPAPSEVMLAALGSCLSVGIQAVATYRGITLSKIEVELEGDIGNPAAWGAGGAEKIPEDMGFQGVRAFITVEGDASDEALQELVAHANYFSPVANSFRNPIPMTVEVKA